MKRDLDLIRHILITIEESENDRLYIENFISDIYNKHTVSYHLALLDDAGFVELKPVKTLGSAYTQYIVHRLTMYGHDYLDTIRDATVWDKTKEKLSTVSSTASLEIVKTLASSIIKGMLGI